MAQDDLNTKAADVLERLQQNQQAQELSIIKLGALVDDKSRDETGKRSSDVSPEIQSVLTPASLESDLAHYKELFSKLRFSYLEQVTKERFIRSIVDDPPLMVEHQENVELEEALAVTKAELKELKTEVADLVVELGKRGRELYRGSGEQHRAAKGISGTWTKPESQYALRENVEFGGRTREAESRTGQAARAIAVFGAEKDTRAGKTAVGAAAFGGQEARNDCFSQGSEEEEGGSFRRDW
ncbi:hypothetical protein BP5796_10536 [Coleophoma crateriformis]|uniref:Kinetochore protein Sos7 coiled-coil domain-containing protein n=1 Tax=Coleophoma crateriformis TaxID=565419 RepID=A0A3D8QRB4_9HELO|nr:hypothetical protein BP5796_10536 [Coleophoma crateriformis]